MKLTLQWTAAVAMLSAIGWIVVQSIRAALSPYGQAVITSLKYEKYRNIFWRDSGGTISFIVFATILILFVLYTRLRRKP